MSYKFFLTIRGQESRAVSQKNNPVMEPLPDLSNLDKDELNRLLKELYDKACLLFGETFDVQHVVKVSY